MTSSDDKDKKDKKDDHDEEFYREYYNRMRREELRRNREYEYSSTSYGFLLFIVIILWIWFIVGLLAFIVSLVCFGFNGSIGDKFLGLIVALIIGPFYWFYFIFNDNYCTTRPIYSS